MKSGLYKWIKYSIFVFSFIFILSFAVFANAGKDDNVFGWWWSDGAGWISLNNCTDPATCSGPTYGVKIDEKTNVISGHAWSDNIGWISFDKNDWSDDSTTVGPPGGFSSSGNTFSPGGWGRALNGRFFAHPSDGRDNRGGYDGWISLGGSNYGFNIDITKDLSPINNFTKKAIHPITGYGWGSEVIGWVESNSKYHKSFVVFDKKCNPIIDPNCPLKDTNVFEVTINGKKTEDIVSGEKVNIDWKAKKTFYPTECTGSMGGSTSPYPDSAWTTKTSGWTYQSQSGVYNSIHVPPSGTTTFRLTCTDGTDVYYDDVAVVTSFNASISGGACINDLTSLPTITWTTNDTSPKCTISADPFYADFTPYTIPSSGYLSTSGSSPYTVTDTNYQYKNTFYKLNCENGDSGYLATVGPKTSFTKMCSSAIDYTLSKNGTSCNLITKDPNSSSYKSSAVTMTLSPNNFTADTDVSVDTTNGTPAGSVSFTPSTGFTYDTNKNDYNTVDVDYTISGTELTKIMNSKYFNGKNIESVDIKVVGKTQNTTPHNQTIYYCVDKAPICPNPNDPNDPKCAKCPDPNNLLCPCDPKDPKCKPSVKPKYIPF